MHPKKLLCIHSTKHCTHVKIDLKTVLVQAACGALGDRLSHLCQEPALGDVNRKNTSTKTSADFKVKPPPLSIKMEDKPSSSSKNSIITVIIIDVQFVIQSMHNSSLELPVVAVIRL